MLPFRRIKTIKVLYADAEANVSQIGTQQNGSDDEPKTDASEKVPCPC